MVEALATTSLLLALSRHRHLPHVRFAPILLQKSGTTDWAVGHFIKGGRLIRRP